MHDNTLFHHNSAQRQLLYLLHFIVKEANGQKSLMIWVGPCSHEMKEQRFKYSCDGLQTSPPHPISLI